MQWVKSIHKWTSLLVGIQLLIWLLTGLYFNVMDVTKVHGDQYQNKQLSYFASPSDFPVALLEPKKILLIARQNKELATKNIQSVNLISLHGNPYYLLTHSKGLRRHFKSDYSIVDAYSGAISDISQEIAIHIAKMSYTGPGSPLSATKLTPPISDLLREKNPVWQVNFADNVETSVYLDARTGEIISHSDNDKRILDFAFMLHFMDYNGVGGFNSWQVILFSIIALWLCLSGFIWTFRSVSDGNYRLKFWSNDFPVMIYNQSKNNQKTWMISNQYNLLDGIVAHNIPISSTCGGGGTCGQCKIKVPVSTPRTSAEQSLLSEKDLKAGYRLACQHRSDEVNHVEIPNRHIEQMTLTLTKSRFVTPFVKELNFELPQGPINFRAGAYMQFHIPASKGFSIPTDIPKAFEHYWRDIPSTHYQHKAIRRSYSLASGDKQVTQLQFIVKLQAASDGYHEPGLGSNYLGNMQPGESIEALGPFEEFYVKSIEENYDSQIVLMGAGSGMAPLKAIIEEQLDQHGANRPIYFFFGARNEVDLIHHALFEHLAIQHPNFHYTPVLSRPSETWQGRKGYVQHAALNSNLLQSGSVQTQYYLCGPKMMMRETVYLLKEKGVKSSAIFCDNFEN